MQDTTFAGLHRLAEFSCVAGCLMTFGDPLLVGVANSDLLRINDEILEE